MLRGKPRGSLRETFILKYSAKGCNRTPIPNVLPYNESRH
jgi:hypothetical protein